MRPKARIPNIASLPFKKRKRNHQKLYIRIVNDVILILMTVEKNHLSKSHIKGGFHATTQKGKRESDQRLPCVTACDCRPCHRMLSLLHSGVPDQSGIGWRKHRPFEPDLRIELE